VAPGDTGGSGLSTVGRLNIAGDAVFGTTGALNQVAHLKLEIGGGTLGNYDQVNLNGVTSALTLSNVDLELSTVNGFDPSTLTIASHTSGHLNMDGSILFLITGAQSTVTGTFANQGAADPGLPTYGTFTLDGQPFAISYQASFSGNSFTGGNDVAIMAIPEPNSMSMLAGSIGVALGLQRLRRRRRS
jgi:hypothetical protein